MSKGTLVAFFAMTVSKSDALAFHVTSMRMLMTKLSSVTILLQNNLEKPRVIIVIVIVVVLVVVAGTKVGPRAVFDGAQGGLTLARGS